MHTNLTSYCLPFLSVLHSARRRFYNNVTVAGNGGIFEVNLDLHKLKTPYGHTLQAGYGGGVLWKTNIFLCIYTVLLGSYKQT